MNLNDLIYYNNALLGKAVYFTDASVVVQDELGKLELWSRADAYTKQENEEAEARRRVINSLRDSRFTVQQYQELSNIILSVSELTKK